MVSISEIMVSNLRRLWLKLICKQEFETGGVSTRGGARGTTYFCVFLPGGASLPRESVMPASPAIP